MAWSSRPIVPLDNPLHHLGITPVLEFLAFYKNFSLLACFAGLGLGYALAARDRIPLLMVVPLLGAQFCFFLFVRLEFSFLDSESTAFEVNPFREQLAMGMSRGNWFDALGLFLLLSVIFLLTALTFVPIGQLCGRLMERRKNLRAYALNLIGSLLGVVMMLVASLLWSPPLVWFALCFLGVLLLHFRQPSPLVAGIVFSIICTIILAWWPLGPLWSRVYSPYQLVEIGTDSTTGLTLIRASGHYYQHVLDLSSHHRESSHDRDYYDFPYKAHPVLNNVAIIGSGTGNELRRLCAQEPGGSMPSRSTRSFFWSERSAIPKNLTPIRASAPSTTMHAPSFAGPRTNTI